MDYNFYDYYKTFKLCDLLKQSLEGRYPRKYKDLVDNKNRNTKKRNLNTFTHFTGFVRAF